MVRNTYYFIVISSNNSISYYSVMISINLNIQYKFTKLKKESIIVVLMKLVHLLGMFINIHFILLNF